MHKAKFALVFLFDITVEPCAGVVVLSAVLMGPFPLLCLFPALASSWASLLQNQPYYLSTLSSGTFLKVLWGGRNSL